MTPEQALQLLDSVAAQVNTNRETHDRLRLAVQVLRQALEQQPKATTQKPD